jgi:hypothetical protein
MNWSRIFVLQIDAKAGQARHICKSCLFAVSNRYLKNPKFDFERSSNDLSYVYPIAA